MISALHRYPKHERRRVAQEWARRSNLAQAAQRLARGPDAETARARALHAARGQLVREGRTFRGAGPIVHWQVRRSRAGRSNQLDILVDGRLWRTAGPRLVRRLLRRAVK